MGDKDYKKIPDHRESSKAYKKIRNEWKKPIPKANHEWDWDNGDGSRCLKCGEKDWYASQYCSGGKE